MNTLIWNDSIRSIEAYLGMVKNHPSSSNSKQTAPLLNSAIWGEGLNKLNRMGVIEAKQPPYALTSIDTALSNTRSSDLHMETVHGASPKNISKIIQIIKK